MLAATLAGCGTGGDREAARAATERFYAALEQRDGAAACEELGEDTAKALASQSGKPCEEAVTELELEGGAVAGVEVYAVNAKVDLDSGESAFLSAQHDGWRLSAVGCTPEEGRPQHRPLDCEVEA